jgi:hypothetical protein
MALVVAARPPDFLPNVTRVSGSCAPSPRVGESNQDDCEGFCKSPQVSASLRKSPSVSPSVRESAHMPEDFSMPNHRSFAAVSQRRHALCKFRRTLVAPALPASAMR